MARSSGQGESASRVVDVSVTLDDPAATGTLDQAPVTVGITSDSRTGVLAVPVNALLALAEGGYGVRVLDGPPEGRIVGRHHRAVRQGPGRGVRRRAGRGHQGRGAGVRRRPSAGRRAAGRRQGVPGVAAAARPAGRRPADRRRRAGGDRGAVGIGEVDPPPRHGHARPAVVGRRADRRPRRRDAVGPGAVGAAGPLDRLRVPAVLPARRHDRRRQRGPGPALPRGPGGRAPAAGGGGAGTGRPGPPARAPARPAVRRRAPTGGHRPGRRGPARPGAGRRAHRQPRQPLERRGLRGALPSSTPTGTTIVVITHDRERAAWLPRDRRDARRSHRATGSAGRAEVAV